MLARKASGEVDGFIIEGPTAGGHNAPPRAVSRDSTSAGSRSTASAMWWTWRRSASSGLPFWLAGGAGQPGRLREAQQAGAAGIQVGTLFAYCDESDLSG